MDSEQQRNLLQGIQKTPNDDALRLIYADFLEESGSAERAEFIRAQIQYANIPKQERNTQVAQALKTRIDDLLEQNGADWLGLDKTHPWSTVNRRNIFVEFEKGFLKSLSIPASTSMDVLKKILDKEPAIREFTSCNIPLNADMLNLLKRQPIKMLTLEEASPEDLDLFCDAKAPGVNTKTWRALKNLSLIPKANEDGEVEEVEPTTLFKLAQNPFFPKVKRIHLGTYNLGNEIDLGDDWGGEIEMGGISDWDDEEETGAANDGNYPVAARNEEAFCHLLAEQWANKKPVWLSLEEYVHRNIDERDTVYPLSESARASQATVKPSPASVDCDNIKPNNSAKTPGQENEDRGLS